MATRKESRCESYDVIVVGSGMGGLSAAALLAKAGKKVLVVEQHDRPGGYAHAFQRKKYLFDSSIHLTGGCEPGDYEGSGLTDLVLKILGVREECSFIRLDPFYSVIYPGFRLEVPTGIEAFIEAHVRLFPESEKGFRRLMGICSAVNREIRQAPTTLNLWELLKFPLRFPTVTKYRNATLGQVMDKTIEDPHLRAVFASLWPYMGLPPSRVSFLVWCLMLLSFVEEGAFTCRGSFQNLVNAYVTALEKNGGELLLHSRVRRILVGEGRVKGIVLDNGQRIEASVVISNADAMQTCVELVGVDHLPSSYVRRLKKLTPSLSAFIVYMATDLDLKAMGVSHEMFYYRSWDHDEIYRSILAGKPQGIAMTVPTLADPTLAPPGEHLVTVMTLIPYELAVSWRSEKTHYAELLLDEVEAVFPGFRSHITFAEGASPRTMERYTLNLTGAIYGWEVSPAQTGNKRPAHEVPVKGLYLSGHWTQPNGGLYAVTVSGIQTAQLILGYKNPKALITDLSRII